MVQRRMMKQMAALHMRRLLSTVRGCLTPFRGTGPTTASIKDQQTRAYKINISFRHPRTGKVTPLATIGRLAALWIVFGAVAIPAASAALEHYQIDHEVPVPTEFSTEMAELRRRLFEILEPDWITNRSEASWAFFNIMRAVEQMESYDGEGEGIQSQPDVAKKYGLLSAGFDVSMKSEEWCREYHLLLMSAAKAAEHIPNAWYNYKYDVMTNEASLLDNDQITPKSDQPKYRKDSCPAFTDPIMLYRKIMTTKGFTDSQKLDAMIHCATFLDFLNQPDEAETIFQEAFDLVSKPYKIPPFNRKTFILNEAAGPPSNNLLEVITQYFTLKAHKQHINIALPALLSILRARRSLPKYPPDAFEPRKQQPSGYFEALMGRLKLPPYPPPPSDGSEPPWRSPEERCEEAKLSILIGEMLFAGTHKEEGIVWTREGIDTAEDELGYLWKESTPTKAMRTTISKCRACLFVGFENWTRMTKVMLDLQKEKDAAEWSMAKETKAKLQRGEISWWERWRKGLSKETVNSRYEEVRKGKSDRWVVEGKVVEAKKMADRQYLAQVRGPKLGWWAFLEMF